MEQQQFRVKWSLSTKLLASLVSILALVVAFLTLASIKLLKKDKTAYVFEFQATTCALAGREFATLIQSTMDLVRHSLSVVDPLKPLEADAQSKLQLLIGSQSIVQQIYVGKFVPSTNEFLPLVQAPQVTSNPIKLEPAVLQKYSPVLMKQSGAFVQLTQMGQAPRLGILLTDRNAQMGQEAGMGVGVVSLQSFASELPTTIGSFGIFNGQGELLFHTESSTLFEGSGSRQEVDFQIAQNSKGTSGAQEAMLDGVKYMTSFYKPGLDLVVTARAERHKIMRSTYTLTERLLLVGILAIAMATFLAVFFAKSVTRPLARVYEATKQVSGGNFKINLPVNAKDELGALSFAFNAMSGKIAELIKKMVDQVRVEQELALASTVQSNLMPLPNYSDKEIRIRGYYKSASECGGDWWSFFRVGNKMAIIVADATGHGIPSALLTASIRGCFSAIHRLLLTRPDVFELSPKDIIPLANAAVYDSGRSGINMTFLMGIIDFNTRKLTFANAAHCAPWMIRRKTGEMAQARMLISAGPRLGEGPEMEPLTPVVVDLEPNDLILFYSDGILEGKNAAGVQYGKKRARKILETQCDRGEDHLIDSLVADFMAHNGDKALDDDVTLVAVTLTPEAFS